MDITNIIKEIQLLAAENEMLRRRIENSTNVEKFYAVAMTTDEVARLHGVSAHRVRDYAMRGLIPLHPSSTDAKLLFRASLVLKLDFDSLKKQKSNQKYFM